MKKYHTAVFIGRLSPMHLGHEFVIKKALENANEVIVVVGSSFAARSFRNPFTFEERKKIIKSVFPQPEVKVVPVSDYPYDDNKWVAAVQAVVGANRQFTPDPERTTLIGHKKDETSYYLNLFKMWDSIALPNLNGYNATELREALFVEQKSNRKLCQTNMSELAYAALIDIMREKSKELYTVVQDNVENQKYIKLWESAPFPPVFVTGDAVLTQSGAVLLIKRGKFPFKDKWALPGGFLNQKETILSGVIRELSEETRVKVPEKVLRGSVKSSFVFDHPNRDPRGRSITHAYHIDLGFPNEKLPKVKGSDDAAEARWFQFSELRQDMMAFDHWHILNHFLKLA